MGWADQVRGFQLLSEKLQRFWACPGEQRGIPRVSRWRRSKTPLHFNPSSSALICSLHCRFHWNKASPPLKKIPWAPVTAVHPRPLPQGSWLPMNVWLRSLSGPGCLSYFGDILVWSQRTDNWYLASGQESWCYQCGLQDGATGPCRECDFQRKFSKSLRKCLTTGKKFKKGSQLICMADGWNRIPPVLLQGLQASPAIDCCISNASPSPCTQHCWDSYKSGGPETKGSKLKRMGPKKVVHCGFPLGQEKPGKCCSKVVFSYLMKIHVWAVWLQGNLLTSSESPVLPL